MFMYLQKNKKGFTLIELMVVVAIIGILALLGLRLYTGQQDKAKESIVKANAGTVQTLIQAELADDTFSSADEAVTAIGGVSAANLRNPFDSDVVPITIGDTAPGQVLVAYTAAAEGTSAFFTITAIGQDGTAIAGYELTAQR